ncbi:MAG: transglutaminase-like domain-containing protein, partial [Candidatus Zixiibacteriota bacterium]
GMALAFVALMGAFGCADKVEENAVTPGKRDYVLKYSFEIDSSMLAEMKEGAEIFCPLAKVSYYQPAHNFQVSTKLPWTIVIDSTYGNEIARFSCDSAFLADSEFFDSDTVEITFWGERFVQEPDSSYDPEPAPRFLERDSLVPIDGVIASEAKSATSGFTSKSEKALALYLHVFESMNYDKTGEGWGRGDALYACDVRKGNCTDIHSLFIGMARSLGIPARFIMGFPLPPYDEPGEVSGYHCWAEFFDEEKGWVPVDISEAIKDPQKKLSFYGSLDANRMAFSVGRDIPLERTDGKVVKVNYLIYPLLVRPDMSSRRLPVNVTSEIQD